MPFKVKDLLVDVASAAVPGGPIICHPTIITCHCSFYVTCHWGCSFHFSCHFGCTFHSPVTCIQGSLPPVTCPGSLITDTTPIIQATPTLGGPVLTNLKQQLKQALDVAEKQEAAEAEGMKPQTVADVEMLEKKFGEGLEELRARKAELQKKK